MSSAVPKSHGLGRAGQLMLQKCNYCGPQPSRRPPKDERDLAIMALHSHIVALENLSHVPDWLSDALCCLSTGSGLSTRKLYADDDEVVFAATRPVILNGIAEVAVRGDLIDRCTFVTLPPFRRGDVRDEQALWAAFHEAHPRILGAVLHAACTALKHRPTTRLTALPRMADYARWVEAAAPALGWAPGAWLAAYEGNREAAVVTALEASPITTALMTYLDAHEPVDRMLMGTLLTALTDHLSGNDRRPLPPTWPRSPQALSTALKQLAPALRSQGIEVTMHRHTKRGTPVSLTWVAREGSELALGDEGDDDYLPASVEVRKRPLSLSKPLGAKRGLRQGTGGAGPGGKTLSPSSPPRTLPGNRLREMRHMGNMASPGSGLDVAQDAQETMTVADALSAPEAILSDRGEVAQDPAQDVSLEHRRANRHARTFVSDLFDLCVLGVPVGSCPWCGSWGRMVRCRGTFLCLDCLQEDTWANSPGERTADQILTSRATLAGCLT